MQELEADDHEVVAQHVVEVGSPCDELTNNPHTLFYWCPICIAVPDRHGIWTHKGWKTLIN